MFTVLFTALFEEEYRQMETKHRLVDTQNYRMPQTNEKRWVHLKFPSQKHDVAHFREGHISDTKTCRSNLLISEERKGPQTQVINFVGVSDVSHVFLKTF